MKYSSQGSFEKLSHDNINLIRRYASDKIQAHSIAALIKGLSFGRARFQRVNGLCTKVYTRDYSIVKADGGGVQHHESLEFHHARFDETKIRCIFTST